MSQMICSLLLFETLKEFEIFLRYFYEYISKTTGTGAYSHNIKINKGLFYE